MRKNGSPDSVDQSAVQSEAPASVAISVDQPGRDVVSSLAMLVGERDIDRLQSMGGVEGVAAALGSDIKSGLKESSVGARAVRYGVNSLPPPELLTLWEFMKESMEDKTIRILIGAALISLLLGMTTPDPRTGEVDRSTGWIEGVAIILSVVIVVIVSSINNYQKQAQFSDLLRMDHLSPMVVVRDGNTKEVPNEGVVVGDVVMVYSGLSLSFDALLIDGNGYICDESSITGEANDVHKSAVNPFLISGTNIIDGCDGIALVVAVGKTSYSGVIAMAVREDKHDTPLQEQLAHMADIIGWFGLVAAIFTFGILFFKEMYVV